MKNEPSWANQTRIKKKGFDNNTQEGEVKRDQEILNFFGTLFLFCIL